MKVAVLYSGGKDSTLATYRARKAGHAIVALISAIPLRQDSWMFHHPNIRHAWVQAGCMGVPWQGVEVSGEKESEVEELKRKISPIITRLGIEALCTGAIASRYQRDRIAGVCRELGLAELSPLWGEPEESLLNELLDLGFDVYFSSVSAEGFGRGWLGSRLDSERVQSLLRLRDRFSINASGEGGEYETFVCDSPIFMKRIRVVEAETIWSRNSGTWNIKRLETIEKRAYTGTG
jgi:diphthine-ammonia ligase